MTAQTSEHYGRETDATTLRISNKRSLSQTTDYHINPTSVIWLFLGITLIAAGTTVFTAQTVHDVLRGVKNAPIWATAVLGAMYLGHGFTKMAVSLAQLYSKTRNSRDQLREELRLHNLRWKQRGRPLVISIDVVHDDGTVTHIPAWEPVIQISNIVNRHMKTFEDYELARAQLQNLQPGPAAAFVDPSQQRVTKVQFTMLDGGSQVLDEFCIVTRPVDRTNTAVCYDNDEQACISSGMVEIFPALNHRTKTRAHEPYFRGRAQPQQAWDSPSEQQARFWHWWRLWIRL